MTHIISDRRASQQPDTPRPSNGILRCSHGNYSPRCPECLKKLGSLVGDLKEKTRDENHDIEARQNRAQRRRKAKRGNR